jgi:multidrug transporter EmrE-like cation transporter
VNPATFLLICVSVCCNAFAQFHLKVAVARAHSLQVAELATRLAPDPQFWLGCVLFGASFGVWLLVLARIPVSVAYPFASLGYVVAAALGWRFLGESLDVARITGIAVICSGVAILARAA